MTTHSPPGDLAKRPMNHEPKAVKYARENAGLTKRALAEMVGISEQLMGDIERGRRNATPDTINKLAEALNCPRVVLQRKLAEEEAQ